MAISLAAREHDPHNQILLHLHQPHALITRQTRKANTEKTDSVPRKGPRLPSRPPQVDSESTKSHFASTMPPPDHNTSLSETHQVHVEGSDSIKQ